MMATETQEKEFARMYHVLCDADKMLREFYELYQALPEGSLQHEKTWITMKKLKTFIRRVEDQFDELLKSLDCRPGHCSRSNEWLRHAIPNYTSRKWVNSCGIRTLRNKCCTLDEQDIAQQKSDAFTRWLYPYLF
jgi:hypothetical protein